jgi:hypothetical protein
VNRNHHHLFACVLFGCTSQPSEGSPAGEPTVGDPDATSSSLATGDAEEAPPEAPPVALARGLGHEGGITEIWLDPRASSALTLDGRGDVRLWPELPPTQTNLAALAPIRVPVREPLSLSLARAGDRSYVVAAIDTAQAARVLEIALDESGNASVRERFRGSPRDPLLELHVLDGGDRLLALGVDHRIRLYDGKGTQLSELTEYGLAPWQLRLSGPPEALQLAMVLAGPTRLQRFTITDDRLAKLGEPRAFTLDRGPNGNDLALLPSGKVAAVLRRPLAKGVQWSIELHDLDSGQVRVLWGEIEAKWRPRMLIVDDDWALLEDGIAGYWVDLRQAIEIPPSADNQPFVLPKKLEELPPESHATLRRVTLPGTKQEQRKRVSVVAGVRAVPSAHSLILDPVSPTPATTPEHHYRLGHSRVFASAVDFAPTPASGDLLAFAHDTKVIVESLASGSEQVVGCKVETAPELAFTDADHLLLIDAKQAQICAWRTGQQVATLPLPEQPSLAQIHIHSTGPGAGEIGFRREEWIDDSQKIELSHTRYDSNQFGAMEPLSKPDVLRWPELSSDWEVAAIDAAGNRYLNKGKTTRTLTIAPASGDQRKLEIVPEGRETVEIRQIFPSPDGRFVALVIEPGSDDYGHSYYGGYASYGEYEPRTLGIWSTSEPAQLVWSTILTETYVEMAWTEDGSRLAIEDSRLRVITREGELVLDRAVRGFELEELPDEPIPSSP